MALDEATVAELNSAIDTATTKPVVTETAKTETVVTDPVVAETAKTETVVTDPVVVEAAKTETAKTETVVTDPVVAETAKTEISDSVMVRAIFAGLDPEAIREFRSESSLLRVVDRLESLNKETVSVEKKAEVGADDTSVKLPDLDPESYDEDSIKMYNGLKAVIEKQQEALNAIRSEQKQSALSAQAASAHEVEKWFDKQVAGLGDDFTEVLGKGDYAAQKSGSPQAQKRDALANQVAVLWAGYKASGQQPPPREDVFAAAAQLVLKDDYLKAREKRLASDLAKRSTQHINRAGGHKVKSDKSPMDEIAAVLDAKYFAEK